MTCIRHSFCLHERYTDSTHCVLWWPAVIFSTHTRYKQAFPALEHVSLYCEPRLKYSAAAVTGTRRTDCRFLLLLVGLSPKTLNFQFFLLVRAGWWCYRKLISSRDIFLATAWKSQKGTCQRSQKGALSLEGWFCLRCGALFPQPLAASILIAELHPVRDLIFQPSAWKGRGIHAASAPPERTAVSRPTPLSATKPKLTTSSTTLEHN